jgi:hypothetical protein
MWSGLLVVVAVILQKEKDFARIVFKFFPAGNGILAAFIYCLEYLFTKRSPIVVCYVLFSSVSIN